MSEPDRSIEEIEQALRKARFEESESDRFLAGQARRKMTEAWIRNSKDERVQRAFIEGYKAAYLPEWKVAAYVFAAIGAAVFALTAFA